MLCIPNHTLSTTKEAGVANSNWTVQDLVAMNEETATTQRKATFGKLSLTAFFIGALVGTAIAWNIISGSEEMASLGAGLAGIAIILMACVPSLIFALIGLIRNEKPKWPAIVGFCLSILPGGLGLIVLVAFLGAIFKK
jgi:hypothetical protein